MKQTRHHLAEVIGEKTLHIVDSKKLSKEIAAFLLYEKCTDDIESLTRDIMQYRSDRGIVEGVAVSINKLPSQIIEDLNMRLRQEFPDAKEIIVSQKQDSDVVGGLRVDFANEQLDLSVKAKLNKFKRLTAIERNSL
ncbi:F0F1 ATP synthase subunit delta [Candidatus Saccharibacteria bacterium]|nr:F0F1 ATP synthase subunit delta [Candidatus Saccharibacteria bacterium]